MERLTLRKPATRVFQHFPRWRSGYAEPMRRSVGTRPRSETTRTRRQREENAIRVYSRLFAVGYLICPHPTKTQTTFGHIFLKTLGKFLKPTYNPHYYKKTEFWKKCVQNNKTPISGYF